VAFDDEEVAFCSLTATRPTGSSEEAAFCSLRATRVAR
jgi:hypothetical protein